MELYQSKKQRIQLPESKEILHNGRKPLPTYSSDKGLIYRLYKELQK
jgi:hypothetical protein